MHWQAQETQQAGNPDIIDLIFSLAARTLPVDHQWALRQALLGALPQLNDYPNIAIHDIHNASSSNGWIKPEHGVLHLSRRTRLCLRLPTQALMKIQALEGKTLDIAGHSLVIGESHTRELSAHKTMFARYVLDTSDGNEGVFIAAVLDMLKEKNIVPPRIISGREHIISTPETLLNARSVMLDGISAIESFRLQAEGIGQDQQIGMGIFLPHKSIDAVYSDKDE